MPESGILLGYTGQVDYDKIDLLLRNFKNSPEFRILDKILRKRVYAILVECLENIVKYASKTSYRTKKLRPSVSVRKSHGKITIKTGNQVSNDKKEELTGKLNQVNNLSHNDLNSLFEKKINTDFRDEERGAGLGFMLMKLKAGNRLDFNFRNIDDDYSYFELIISVNEYLMRKLIIDKTTNSPKVILDPERNQFEISGESRPPNVAAFYEEIISWLDDYSIYLSKSSGVSDPVMFNLDFEYFNSSSAKYILDFCKQLANIRSKGNNLSVNWRYDFDDTDMFEVGKVMSKMAKIPFEFVQKNRNT